MICMLVCVPSCVSHLTCVPVRVCAGGLGFILHTWALAEYEQDNVYNAQVVVAQGLRKCPYDAQLFVAAASIELKGGNAGEKLCTYKHTHTRTRTQAQTHAHTQLHARVYGAHSAIEEVW